MSRKRFLTGLFCGLQLVALGSGLAVVPTAQAEEAAPVSQLPAIKSEKVAQSLLQDIVRVGDRLVVVGERGHIAYSDDSGKTWTQADVPTRAMLNAVFFVDSTIGWAVGYDGLVLHTRDGGVSWSIQLDGIKFTRQRMAEAIPELESGMAAAQQQKELAEVALAEAEAAGKEDLSALEDAVSDWDDKLSTLETELDDAKAALADTVANPLMDVWFRDADHGFAVGGFGDFLRTDDGGVTWRSIAPLLNNEDRHHLNAITGLGQTMFIAAEAGHVYRSDDGGESWQLVESPDPENGSFFAVSMLSKEQVFLAGLRGAMYRSADGGLTWKQIDEDLHKNMNAWYLPGKDVVLAVGNDGALLRSRDAGRTFQGHVRKNRLTIASIVEAPDGNYVTVGLGGVQLIAPGSLQ